ncbi:c-type cytochrome [Sinorhizobium terangae]|nr:mono/diheme cytochrome c family protein [Sinorhizobium terangae]
MRDTMSLAQDWPLTLAAAATLFMVCACWFLTMPVASFESTGSTLTEGSASRGEIIFAAGGCASCHATPGQPDPLKLGGGLALASPFGTFRVPNISPDPVDGIGSWSVADLANALISGVSPEGRHYYPAFPYPSYTGMRPDDVRDLYAYLQTLPRVSGRAPPHDLFLFFRIRRFVGFWKLLFFREGKSEAMLNEDPVHDRGAYLVEALAHCADCHSTRNIFGAIRPTTRFAGGPDLEGTGFVPNITPARIGGWSEGELAEMLKSGRTPNHGRVGSSMRDVVANTSQLPESDRIAIARYIKSLPARPTPHP